MQQQLWTDADFDRMSWHDNHVHGIHLVAGENGAGELILDIDHIVEWQRKGNAFEFRIQPALLAFHGVMFPRISVDYAAPTAGFGPFMIDGIERRTEPRAHYDAVLWKIPISWPGGQIEFEARGFVQRALGAAVVASDQLLTPEQRRHAPRTGDTSPDQP